MKAFYERPGVLSLLCADVLEGLGSMESAAAQICVTSPPYWGLRDYGLPPTTWPEVSFTPMPGLPPLTVPGWKGCLGLEPEPLAFVAHLVHVFREVRRVLAEDGTLWLNLGDSYASSGGTGHPGKHGSRATRRHMQRAILGKTGVGGVKAKDMLGIPWRVAFALQADGWWLRSDVIWAKPNPMPESVTDRPTKAHEYVFLLAKSERYLYVADAIRQPLAEKTFTTFGTKRRSKGTDALGKMASDNWSRDVPERAPRLGKDGEPAGANARTVWTVATQPYTGAHFATMPTTLAERCVLAGSTPGSTILDPFSGAGTTGLVALRNSRLFLGVELNPTYCAMALERWRQEFSLFPPRAGCGMSAQRWLFAEHAPRFRTILMDPPWEEAGGGGRGAQNHYPLVPVEKLPALVRSSGLFLPYPDASHLWLWVTNNFLPAGLWLMEQLGFRYVSNVSWVKPGAGIGQYLRGRHELLLFGVLGEGMSPAVLTERRNLSTVLEADWEREGGRKVHSAKPRVSYELVESRSKGPYLELFARGEPRSPEWTVWGNEAQPSSETGRAP